MLGVAQSGYYDWLKQPLSKRAREDVRLLKLIQASFVASHGIYKNRQLAETDVRDYIETFYNPSRRHSHLDGVSPDQFEAAHRKSKRGVH